MIGRVAGTLIQRGTDQVMIDVRGIGYIVHVSDRTLAALPSLGQFCALHTELLVREDLLQLFGFLTPAEKEWHRLLTSVQGIGARGAMAILGTLGPDGAARAVALGDWNALKAAPGIGPKIAQRVVLELKGKAPAMMAMGALGAVTPRVGSDGAPSPATDDADQVIDMPGGAFAPEHPPEHPPGAQATADAMSALTNLGYAPGEAAAAVARAAAEDPTVTTSSLIRDALRLLAPRG